MSIYIYYMCMKDDNYFDNLKYNSCISKGICSINPRISALQNVLWLYLQLCSKYSVKLYKKSLLSDEIKTFILSTIAISVSNTEFTEDWFMEVISKLKEILPNLIKTYNKYYEKEDFKGENILSSDIFQRCENIVDAIKLGEYIFKTQIAKTHEDVRNLFKIILIIAKSLCINILDLESYEITSHKKAFITVLELINSIGVNNTDLEKLKGMIRKAADCNTDLMKALHHEQEKRYGKQRIVKISYTTTPSKAVLAVGSNIRELELILEALKNTKIDVYTHDEMMVAHTFPKFSEYTNLKGQFGHGVENCLIDFATFPGPIILTKHAMHNIENLYRGRLFTTDINFYKGVLKIENNDFEEVIESAKDAKGFKKGKICETVSAGYDYDKCIKDVEHALNSNQYKKFVLIGLKDYSSEQKEYFKNLLKLINEDVLIISFSYNFPQKNLLYYNACFDSFAVVRTALYLEKFKLPIHIFFLKCGKNTLAEMIHFEQRKRNTVYIGECNPITINPSVKKTLQELFDIRAITIAKNDAENINKL